MAKNKSSFNMLPDDVSTENIISKDSNTSNISNTQVNNNVTNTSDVTSTPIVTEAPKVTMEQPVMPSTPVMPVPEQPVYTQPVQQIVQPINQPGQVVQQVIVQQVPVEERKRIYVSITMDHYRHAKKESGATGITLQEYFDGLIEKDMRENEPHYK